MKRIFAALILSMAFVSATLHGAGTENFAGEWADKNYHGNSVFQLSVEQTGSNVSIVFSANHTDGSGAAPEADGKGKLTGKGTVEFTWSDSFSNAGKGTIRKAGPDVIASIKATRVADSRCLIFYGDNIRLKPAGRK
jgi:hypothetical protein